MGRAHISRVALPQGITITIVVIYGMVNGHFDATARSFTDQLLDAAVVELSMWPQGPKWITGDLNCDFADLQTLARICSDEGWSDVGAIASRWGGTDHEPTCLAAGSREPTRRDYFLVNEDFYPLIRRFVTAPLTSFPPTHPFGCAFTWKNWAIMSIYNKNLLQSLPRMTMCLLMHSRQSIRISPRLLTWSNTTSATAS